MTPEQLKSSILQYAIQGKLVEQRVEEGTGEELYQQIQAEKQRLIQEKKIKKEKPLAEISEDEVPFDIPESWKWVKVGNVGSWSSGATPSRTNPAYYGGIMKDGKNQMLKDGVLSETARKAIAGMMVLAPSITAFGNTNPTSYFRLS